MDQEELELLLEARESLREVGSPENELICECECVSLEDIRGFTKGNKVDLKALTEHFNLGAGCSSCIKSYDSWKTKI